MIRAPKKPSIPHFLLLAGLFLASFVLIALVLTWIRQGLTGEAFAKAWRWVHEYTVIPSNFILMPTTMLLFIGQAVFQHSGQSLLHKLPSLIHNLIFLALCIFAANGVSQAAGGCIWFVFTEGWWVRFGHNWNWIDGSIIPEEVVITVYVAFTIISTILAYWFYRNFLVRAQTALS